MKKEIEDYLWNNFGINGYEPWPRDIINHMLAEKMIHSPKQAWRTLEKWRDKRIYEYGSRLDLGWKIKND